MNAQVGDWGREGMQNQTAVAALMAQVAGPLKPDFILSMGDNFYESMCCWPSWLACKAQFAVRLPGMYACAACWAELCRSTLAKRVPHVKPSLASAHNLLQLHTISCICTQSPCIFDMMMPLPGSG